MTQSFESTMPEDRRGASKVVMMKAAIGKELRQLSGWFALGLTGTTLALTFVLYSYADDPESLLAYTFAVTALVSPVVALMFGAAQTISESQGDRWAFLSHRPVSRSMLWFAKTVAGLILYAVAVGAPSVAALIWMSAPGNVPMPFDWRMALPVGADLFGGIAYFAAGQFIGMRHARWHMSRVASLGIPLVGSFAAQLTSEFWQAMLWSGVGSVIMGAAALGTFKAGGRFESQPRSMRAATGVVVGAGVMALSLVVFIVVSLLWMMSNVHSREGSAALRQPYTSYALTDSGTIVQVLEEDRRILEVRDFEGRVIPQTGGAISVTQLAENATGYLIRLGDERWVTYRSTNHFFIRVRRPDRGPVSWYYAVGPKLIAAYDNRSAVLLEWLGPDASNTDAPPATRFGGDPLFQSASREFDLSLLPFKDAVYSLELEQRKLARIFVVGAGESVLGVSREGTQVAIATTERLLIQHVDGQTQFSAPHPVPARQYAHAVIMRAWAAPRTPVYLWYYPEPARRPLPVEVRTYTPEGAALERYTLPFTVGFTEAEWHRAVFPWLVTPLTVPVALGLTPDASWRSPFDVSLSNSGTTSLDAFRYRDIRVYESMNGRQSAIAWSLCALASSLSAALAFRWARVYAFSRGRLWYWTILSFLLGPLALAVLTSLAEFPRRETCSSCSRLRVVTRERCEHCGAAFPPPALDGTEIIPC